MFRSVNKVVVAFFALSVIFVGTSVYLKLQHTTYRDTSYKKEVAQVVAPTENTQAAVQKEIQKFSDKINSPDLQKYALTEADMKLLSDRGWLTPQSRVALKPVSKN